MSSLPAIIAAIASVIGASLTFWAQNRVAQMQTQTQDSIARYWFEHLQWSIEEMAKDLSSDNGRLIELQHALVDLIHYLDPNYMRFDKDRYQKA